VSPSRANVELSVPVSRQPERRLHVLRLQIGKETPSLVMRHDLFGFDLRDGLAADANHSGQFALSERNATSEFLEAVGDYGLIVRP